jgi:hypothetical protein
MLCPLRRRAGPSPIRSSGRDLQPTKKIRSSGGRSFSSDIKFLPNHGASAPEELSLNFFPHSSSPALPPQWPIFRFASSPQTSTPAIRSSGRFPKPGALLFAPAQPARDRRPVAQGGVRAALRPSPPETTPTEEPNNGGVDPNSSQPANKSTCPITRLTGS